MNIQDAKEQIKHAMTAYFSKDEFGEYIIPIESQRPVFLMGPPGIGKTAIIKQVASELGVGLLSYSMTHHTRQSALGLPFIVEKNYGGMECSVSEYTMSEIIASVYDYMEDSGIQEGILFLDEINCTSETLAPIMLQFLQYKTFGKHKIPDGWIVVTAGNPPEYNNSVREFDIVTWDRLKRVDVEPDFDVWKEFAYKMAVHPAILTYLEIKKRDFYRIETTVDGKSFVTARGWMDLSQMIVLYEKNKIKVDEKLIHQYIQNKKIAKQFTVYYDLFNKYRSDYQVEDILNGKVGKEIKERAKKAQFDERVSLLGILLGTISDEMYAILNKEEMLTKLLGVLKQYKKDVANQMTDPYQSLYQYVVEQTKLYNNKKKAGNFAVEEMKTHKQVISTLEQQCNLIKDIKDSKKAFQAVKKDFDTLVKEMNTEAKKTGKRLSNLFLFCEEVFEEGHELLILVTELTVNHYSAKFISQYGCKEYFKHNKELLFYERQKKLIEELEDLSIETDI